MKLLSKRESGQALILVLVLLLIGGLMLPSLLALASTGLKSSQVYEQKTDEFYASISGVEDALWRILHDPSLDGLECGDPPYPLPQQVVNGLLVDVVVTKLSLIGGFGEDYIPGQPHQDWWVLELAAEQVGDGEYSCEMTVTHIGDGNRQLETIGAFFAPFPGDTSVIEGPYDIDYTGAMTSAGLEDGSPETKVASGGFAFIWRWQDNPWFSPPPPPGNTGTVSFTFNIPDWSYSDCFLWATVRQNDVSYVTNAPGLNKWLIEATAGDTTVRSVAIGDTGGVSVLTWEIQ